ncbi:MAG: HAMP domain-containing histidine kinase [Bacteroidales bacterium]|nr:HAMP domain-containing histidine kinase [Bacteroidales bacterium]MBN2820979.1 HAMP domain-containing histidine kinase [Bacteroidales bacterium]
MKEFEKEIERLNSELSELKRIHQAQIQENKITKEKAERNEKMLRSVVEAAAGKIGQDFFDNIILRLSEWLGAECVLIGKMVEQERIEAVPLLLDGKITHGFSYELAGSPCDITTRKGFCSFSGNVIDLFPKDQILVDLQAESYIGSALYNKEGETNGVICAVSRKKLDIPPYAQEIMKIIGARVTAEIDRQKMEEELQRSEKELRESNNTKDKFFSIISHDLQNPLNVLSGFSSLMVNDFDKFSNETKKKYINHIHKAAESMRNLVGDLLTWSLTQRGMIVSNPEELLLTDIVLSVIKSLETFAADKTIAINSTIKAGIKVKADKNMLTVIFRNIISNAIKFTSTGGKIGIYVEDFSETRNIYHKVTIQDTGVGIEPERLKSIFRIDEVTSTPGTNNETGTGLGLVLCKEFIEQQGGNIWVESKVGEGSKFIFTLPKA